MTAPGSRPRYSIVETVLLGDDFADDLRIAVEAGIDTVGLSFLGVRDRNPADCKRLLDEAGLSVSSYMALFDIVDSPDSSEATIELAAALGAPSLLVCSGPIGTRTFGEADRSCRQWLEKMAPVAADSGVKIVFEPLHPMRRQYSYVHTLSHALRIAGGIDNVGIVVDTGHLYWDPDLVDDFQRNVDAVGLVQFDNVDTEALNESRFERKGLVDGDVPVESLLQAFHAAGYTGYYEFEGVTPVPPQERAAFARSSREWFDASFAG
jgi:sugar phosphate isomerase/epimerase